jgi:hypothetical protein
VSDQELRREAKGICKKKKNKRMKRHLEEVNKFKDQNERRKFYKAMDNLKKRFIQEIMAVETEMVI